MADRMQEKMDLIKFHIGEEVKMIAGMSLLARFFHTRSLPILMKKTVDCFKLASLSSTGISIIV